MADSETPGIRYWSLVEPIWDQISIYDGPDVFQEQFRAAPPVAATLFAAHWCQSEVCNGGFDQFFYNPTGVLAPEALAAYRTMGLTEWSDSLAEAMAYFDTPYPRDRDLRLAVLTVDDRRVRRARFEELDDRFFAWLNAEPDRWERAADEFARRHQSA
jgi:hypothetical protein